MAILDKVALVAKLNNDINTNGTRAITGAIHNAFLNDFVDSTVNKNSEAFWFLREYDTGVSYPVGFTVTFGGSLYKSNTPTSGAFNASHWDEIGGGSSVTDLNDLGDVAAAAPAPNDVLFYNNATSQWEAGTVPVAGVDVTISDSGGFWSAGNAESLSQEIGGDLNNIYTSLGVPQSTFTLGHIGPFTSPNLLDNVTLVDQLEHIGGQLGSSSSIYTSDDSLTGTRVLDLSGNTLSYETAGGDVVQSWADNGNSGFGRTPFAASRVVIKGETSDSTTNALEIQSSSNITLWRFQNDGILDIGTSSTYRINMLPTTAGGIFVGGTSTGAAINAQGSHSLAAGYFSNNAGLALRTVTGDVRFDNSLAIGTGVSSVIKAYIFASTQRDGLFVQNSQDATTVRGIIGSVSKGVYDGNGTYTAGFFSAVRGGTNIAIGTENGRVILNSSNTSGVADENVTFIGYSQTQALNGFQLSVRASSVTKEIALFETNGGSDTFAMYSSQLTWGRKMLIGDRNTLTTHNGSLAIESTTSGTGLYFTRSNNDTLQYNVYVGGASEHVYHAISNSDMIITRGLAAGGNTSGNHLATYHNNGRVSIVNDSSDGNYNGWKFFIGQNDNDSNAARGLYVKSEHTSTVQENTGGYFEANSVSANANGHFGARFKALGNSLDYNFGWQVIDGGTIHGLNVTAATTNPAGSYFSYIGPSSATPPTPPANSIVLWVDSTGNYKAKGASGTVTTLAIP